MGTFTKLTYHVVFSTKYRKPLIAEEIRGRLYEYIGGIVRGLNGHLIEIGGIADHVHLVANLSPATALSASIRDIKANACRWANETVTTAAATRLRRSGCQLHFHGLTPTATRCLRYVDTKSP